MRPIYPFVIALLAANAIAPSSAAELDITARFRPSPTDPNITQFVNTTPLSGYCYGNTSQCKPGDFTIMTALGIQRTWEVPGPIEAQNYQRVDGNWKRVTVYSDQGGQPFEVNFRLNLLARRYWLGILAPGGIPGTIGMVANSSGINGASSGGCVGRIGGGNIDVYEYAWSVPIDLRTCTRDAIANSSVGPYNGALDRISVGYEMVAPNPLQLPNGTYTGQIDYRVGHGQQLDLGAGDYSDDLLTFRFSLTVEHQISVEFPAGSDRVMLEPEGGWLDWLNKGRRPTRLYRDQPFRLQGSAPMKMHLLCQYPLGDHCAIASGTDQVPVDIAISLPEAFRHQGQPINRLSLPVGAPNALTFETIRPLFNGRSQIHYSVASEHLDSMLANPGSTYRGDVTLVFDAQI